ncbi:CCR4-NOT core subunit [Hanseniaspora uvarum]|nr:CCR4-NOT core subunit [Hanseniaspora uvarum]
MSSSQRKLYQEIDKFLKKVREGIQDFDQVNQIFEQTDPTNHAYREKLELDINKQIKKLQKQREQIKTWLSKEDVKDREDLLADARKNIEYRMEIAKSVEKMVKLKKFSTQALANPDMAIHPKDLKKYKLVEFLQECIDELNKQKEMLEGEIEHGNDDMHTEHLLERHLFNIVNLENVLKLVNTDGLDVADVEEIKDDIQYYVDNNMDDPDFIEYDTIFEDLGCEVQVNEFGEMDTTANLSTGAITKESSVSIEGTPKKSTSIKKEVTINKSITPSATQTTQIVNLTTTNNIDKTSVENIQISSRTIRSENSLQINDPTNVTVNDPLNKAFTNKLPTVDIDDKNVKISESGTKFIIASENGETEYKETLNKIKKDKEALKENQESKFAKETDLSFGIQKLLDKRLQTKFDYTMDADLIEKLLYSLLNTPDCLDSDFKRVGDKDPLSKQHPISIFFSQVSHQFADNIFVSNLNPEALPIIVEPENVKHGMLKLGPNSFLEGTEDRSTNWYRNLNQMDTYSSLAACKINTKFSLETLFFIFYHYQDRFEQFVSARELHLRGWKFEVNESKWYKNKAGTDVNGKPQEAWEYFDFEDDWKIKTTTSFNSETAIFENLNFTTAL